MFPRRNFGTLKEIERGADQPVASIVVSHGNGNSELDCGVLLNVEEIRPWQVAGRGFQVKNSVEHQLQLRSPRAQHRIEAPIHASKGRL